MENDVSTAKIKLNSEGQSSQQIVEMRKIAGAGMCYIHGGKCKPPSPFFDEVWLRDGAKVSSSYASSRSLLTLLHVWSTKEGGHANLRTVRSVGRFAWLFVSKRAPAIMSRPPEFLGIFFRFQVGLRSRKRWGVASRWWWSLGVSLRCLTLARSSRRKGTDRSSESRRTCRDSRSRSPVSFFSRVRCIGAT